MFIPLLKLEVAIGFDTDKGTFQATADEKIGPLPDAQQQVELDTFKAVGFISGGLKGEVTKLLGKL